MSGRGGGRGKGRGWRAESLLSSLSLISSWPFYPCIALHHDPAATPSQLHQLRVGFLALGVSGMGTGGGTKLACLAFLFSVYSTPPSHFEVVVALGISGWGRVLTSVCLEEEEIIDGGGWGEGTESERGSLERGGRHSLPYLT